MINLVLMIFLYNSIYAEDKEHTKIKINTDTLNIAENIKKTEDNKKQSKDKITKDNTNNNIKKKKKYSKKPSSLGFGIDLFTLLYNYLTHTKSSNDSKSNSYIDIRFKCDTDFNRILFGINGGILKWKTEQVISERDILKTTNAFFINPCVYYNFFKKNSYRNALYAGGGINFNRTLYKETDKSNDEYSQDNTFSDKTYWLWFTIELGNRINLIKFLHINANFRITFLNFHLKTITDKKNIKHLSKLHNLYGYGYVNKSYNIEFCLNIIFNINLPDDEAVINRESYLNI